MELLEINNLVYNYVSSLSNEMKYFYRAGIQEERMRLYFRLQEGVKNIDIDCVEINNKRGILAYIEFKRGLLKERKYPKLASYAELKVMRELKEKTGKPGYVLRFDDKLEYFQIFNIDDEKHNYDKLTLEDVWGWRQSLNNET